MEQNGEKCLCLTCHEVTDKKDICGFSNGNICKMCVTEIIEQFISQTQDSPVQWQEDESDDSE